MPLNQNQIAFLSISGDKLRQLLSSLQAFLDFFHVRCGIFDEFTLDNPLDYPLRPSCLL
jgi:hypothetical protein